MVADQLTWPGVDKQRAVAVAFHLERALRQLEPRLSADRWWRLMVAKEHLRIARGFLGAVGFEHSAGLWR